MGSVVFIGAGTSIGAGYPATERLLGEIEQSAQESWFCPVRDDWHRFKAFRKSARGVLGEILNSPNPELILTIPDILEATRKEIDERAWRDYRGARQRGDKRKLDEVNKRWNKLINSKLTEGRSAKWSFQRVADRFFSWKHIEDSNDTNRARRKYLHNGLAQLRVGDVVITTNYDTLAERTLLEIRKWYVGDGYGFSVPLKIHPRASDLTHGESLPSSSAVKVLKLHGSMGWFRKEKVLGVEGELYLRKANYLQYLNPPGFQGTFSDQNAPNVSGPDMNPVIIYPSYLKQLEDSVIQSIWDQAATALAKATKVTFVGYSLPPADIAIRVLINPLRRRIAEGSVRVTVVNPTKGDRDRFVEFLGAGVNVIDKTAEQYWA